LVSASCRAKVQAGDIVDLELRVDPFRLSNLRGFIGVGGNGNGNAAARAATAPGRLSSFEEEGTEGAAAPGEEEQLPLPSGGAHRAGGGGGRSRARQQVPRRRAAPRLVHTGRPSLPSAQEQRDGRGGRSGGGSSSLQMSRFGPGNPLSAWEIPPADLTLGRKLAAGGSGQVFAAEHLGRPVAVKQVFAQAITPESLGACALARDSLRNQFLLAALLTTRHSLLSARFLSPLSLLMTMNLTCH
jgi:hypothetical protein